jgi:hypothetical protein
MGLFLMLIASLPAWCAPPDARAIITKAMIHDARNEKMRRDYTYLERQEEREFDASGKTVKTEVNEYEHMNLYGQNHRRHVRKNGNPLPDKEARKEQEKLDKIAASRKDETASQRENRLAEADRRAERRRRYSRQIPEIYDFTLLSEEKLDGRDVWVIGAEPKPGYRATESMTKAMTKMHGKFWIDKATNQMVKLDAEALDTVSFGFFLVRLNKGARFILEQTRVNDEVWLPKRMQAALDARVAVVKKFRGQMDVTFSNYRKFQSDSRIVDTAEIPPVRPQ